MAKFEPLLKFLKILWYSDKEHPIVIICGKFQVPIPINVFFMSKSLKMHIFAQKCNKMPQKALSQWMLKVQQAVPFRAKLKKPKNKR